MSAIDKNKIFFGLIHYILSEQSNVDWILKTSLVNFTGINSTLDNKKYKKNSVTKDIIEYIYQVKPYHVQFEQFIEKYSSQQDDVNIKAKESNNIELNVRYDAVTSEVDEQGILTDEEYMNTHMANRLWLYKHKEFEKIYNNTTAIYDYIKDVMNCHFKGITVDGSEFIIDRSGYDAFLYDSTLYDAPTISNDYCLVNFSESLQYPYTKEFIKVGVKTLVLNSLEIIYPTEIQVISNRNGKEEIIDSYKLKDNIITLFEPIREYEKISVIYTKNNIRQGFIFVGHPFIENSDEYGKKQFVDINTVLFDIPESEIASKKLTIHIEHPNGSRYPTNNYEIENGKVHVYDKIEENYHVIITVIDYKSIYDKIYTYEDCYGLSNNLITLDGDDLLRPYYEKERPSELCVSYPLQNLFIYKENEKGKIYSFYHTSYNNSQSEMSVYNAHQTKLSQDLNIGDKIILVDNINKLDMPTVDEEKNIIPGKILVGSEIIEYYEVEKDIGNKGILKSIRRGIQGTYLAEQHKKGSNVYAYTENSLMNFDSQSVNISTYIKKDTKNKFEIPGSRRIKEYISVYKKPLITLLTDIKVNGKSFDISSNNIKLPGDVVLLAENEFKVLNHSQVLGVEVDGKLYKININNEYDKLDDFVNYINKESALREKITVLNENNRLKMISHNGNSIKLYNITGYPLQEILGLNTISVSKPIILKDGYNGISVNGNNIYWGNDKSSLKWMHENPEHGTVEDIVDTINNNIVVNKIIKAYVNNSGALEIVSLINDKIKFGNLTDVSHYQYNLELLGISDTIPSSDNLYFNDDNEMYWFNDNPSSLGYIFINNDKLYFRNINQRVQGSNISYRITNYYSDKEYIANESKIWSVQPEVISSNDYKIVDENYIVFNSEPKVDEIVIISNLK